MLRVPKTPWSTFRWFILGNELFFIVYRLLFLQTIVPGSSGADRFIAGLYGLRLDGALLGLELSVLGLIALLLGSLSLRSIAAWLWGLTYLHLFVCAANLLFFQERNQHLWGMFLANISEPGQIFIAVAPLLYQMPLLVASIVTFSVAFVFVAYRQVKQLAGEQRLRVHSAGARRNAIVAVLLLAAFSLEPIRIKTSDWPLGWYLGFTASRY